MGVGASYSSGSDLYDGKSRIPGFLVHGIASLRFKDALLRWLIIYRTEMHRYGTELSRFPWWITGSPSPPPPPTGLNVSHHTPNKVFCCILQLIVFPQHNHGSLIRTHMFRTNYSLVLSKKELNSFLVFVYTHKIIYLPLWVSKIKIF